MTARNSDIDSAVIFADRQGVGVRGSAASLLEYDLTVIARDVADVVQAAGGWLCDRVRAGWQVSVVLTGDFDVRPFQVLGVRAMPAGTDLLALVRSGPAALAISADVLDADPTLRADVLRVVERGGTELTVWGKWHSGVLAGRVAPTRHRMSAAARAFKGHALAAAGSSCGTNDSVEEFHSCALWYPPEGSDLMPVG
jgi:hypothetical protein